MSQPTLFDEPLARLSDPETAHEAARALLPGNDELIRKIRLCVSRYGPMSAFDVARHIDASDKDRWASSSIISACSRAGLEVAKISGVSPRGRRCQLFILRTEPTSPL